MSVAVSALQKFNGFLQHTTHSVLFVVRGDYHGHEYFRIFHRDALYTLSFLLGEFFAGFPTINPAW
jgi:hypothetical protein